MAGRYSDGGRYYGEAVEAPGVLVGQLSTEDPAAMLAWYRRFVARPGKLMIAVWDREDTRYHDAGREIDVEDLEALAGEADA